MEVSFPSLCFLVLPLFYTLIQNTKAMFVMWPLCDIFMILCWLQHRINKLLLVQCINIYSFFTPELVCLCVDLSPPHPLWLASHWLWRAAVAGRPALVWTPPGSWPPEASVWRKCRRTLWQMFCRFQWQSWCFSAKDDENVKETFDRSKNVYNIIERK